MKVYQSIFFVSLFTLFQTSCTEKKENVLFTKLSAEKSGIHFSNDLEDNDSADSFINEFGYMGGGVGIGDFNNDGLKDIFFSGNQKSCRLYINKGENKFTDITESAGLTTSIWATGVSIVDINNDGYDDIYVCAFGKNLVRRCQNLLFINQRNLSFKEQAVEYNLADTSFSSQAVFFDYDKDGDLDMYLANYLLGTINTNIIYPRDRTGRSAANDRLYRNDGDSASAGHPVFTDVTIEANIKESGYGLGVVTSDFNNDGWPDIYVANDFLSNDVLWLNNRNGTFTNCIDRSIQHQSYSSMGADAADINNDGLQDIVTLDMLPEVNQRKKTTFFFMNYERYEAERAMGYEPEFMRNMLQINNGTLSAGDTSLPFFSEIGQLAGIHATDWSWSVLLADFDNDGWKDMHITNGIGRDFINADWLEFSNKVFSSTQTREAQQKAIRKRLAELKPVNLPNYLYINQHNYTFADVSEVTGISEASMSNGAAYADLDNDGDFDIVVNNIDKEAFVFINNTNGPKTKSQKHYLALQLQGDTLNTHAFGAKVFVYVDGRMQVQEQNPARGYFSSVDHKLIFGLGNIGSVDSVVVVWPDNKKQVLRNASTDTTYSFSYTSATGIHSYEKPRQSPLFSDISSRSGIQYRHRDVPFNDFSIQRLLPQKFSQLGPFVSNADINRDGKMDFFVGNGFNFSGSFFIQQKDQSFVSKNLVDSIKMEEDMDCILFDADNDGNTDLLITGGDFRYEEEAAYHKPRFYSGNDKGALFLKPNAIPSNVKTMAGCVVAADYDGDGDQDLFIGGRVSRKYPQSPRSYLLENNNGIFTDVTAKRSPELQYPGMITSATWTDFDNDKKPDLVIAGEWMSIRFFKNTGETFRETTASTGLTEINGMWRTLISLDIDNDGDVDLVAGNYGLNNTYKASGKEPMNLYAADIDGNGSIDPVMFYYIKDDDGARRSYPAISRNLLAEQVPGIKKRFLLYKDYARATYDEIFKGKKESVLKLYCDETRTCFFENLGNGRFKKNVLPIESQFSPVNAIVCEDFDHDGIKDLLMAGNEHQTEVVAGRYDASYGCFLKGNADKSFTSVPMEQTGFVVKGDVKDMCLVPLANDGKIIVVAVNNDSLRIFSAR